MSNLPPGWYLDQSGQNRYWTGTEWVVAASTPVQSTGKNKKMPKWLIAGGVAGVLAIFGAVGYTVWDDKVQEQARIEAAEAAAQERITQERKAEDKRVKDEKSAQEQQAEAERKIEEAAAFEREQLQEQLQSATEELEELGLQLAAESAKEPGREKVLRVSCMPVTGTDLASVGVLSTSFSCLAVTKENDDGSSSGYRQVGSVNWDVGEMQINWEF